jgi:hypothetical protein
VQPCSEQKGRLRASLAQTASVPLISKSQPVCLSVCDCGSVGVHTGVHAAGENCPGPSLGVWPPMRRTTRRILHGANTIMMTAVAMMLRKRLAILTTVCVFVPQPAIGSGSSPVAKSR